MAGIDVIIIIIDILTVVLLSYDSYKEWHVAFSPGIVHRQQTDRRYWKWIVNTDSMCQFELSNDSPNRWVIYVIREDIVCFKSWVIFSSNSLRCRVTFNWHRDCRMIVIHSCMSGRHVEHRVAITVENIELVCVWIWLVRKAIIKKTLYQFFCAT